MGVLLEYLKLQRKFQQEYGDRTVLVYQMGSFYEIYEYDPTHCSDIQYMRDEDGVLWEENIGHAVQLSITLNCTLSQENKNKPYSVTNLAKIGFPIISYEKNRRTLLANDYIIVRMDQVKKDGKVERIVAEVCNPNMDLDTNILTKPTNNIICIYIEYQTKLGKRWNDYENIAITTGVTSIDVTTGQNKICEFYSKREDNVNALQELYRFLLSHNPIELLIRIDDLPEQLIENKGSVEDNSYVRFLYKTLELNRFERVNVKLNSTPKEYVNINYQTEFLNKIFNSNISKPKSELDSKINIKFNVVNDNKIIHKTNPNIISDLGIEIMNYGRISYIILLQHCYFHNRDIISRINNPNLEWLDESKHLILTHNAITQLDILPKTDNNKKNKNKKSDIDSLFTIIDETCTHLGKRLLREMILNPLIQSHEIEEYYDKIDETRSTKVDISSSQVLWLVLERKLKELPDIERLQRKLSLQIITPRELSLLFRSYAKLVDIYIMVHNLNVPSLHKELFSVSEITEFNDFLNKYNNLFDLNSLETCYIDKDEGKERLEFDSSPVNPNYYSDVDVQYNQMKESERRLQEIVDHLNLFLQNTKGKLLSFTERKKGKMNNKKGPMGTMILTTQAKSTLLSQSKIDINLCGILQFLPVNSDKMITSDIISNLSSNIDKNREWLKIRYLEIYNNIVYDIINQYKFFPAIIRFIARIDLIHSYAKIAEKYKYFRPEIVRDDNVESFMEIKDLRHPIIERIIDSKYITNDLNLGRSPKGMLLYGSNKTGKSSMAKAIGLNIIMAQAGCFVPSKLRFKPYQKIITRLSGNDNLFNDESSFTIEMSELRTILRHADTKTLVLGDELCRGTESRSAVSLTVATILTLLERNCSFIFATHMHNLMKLNYIKSIDQANLRICHLSLHYDPENEILIYDRKLQEGSGTSNYGREVARSVGLNPEFMELTDKIWLELEGLNEELIPIKKSKYNSKVYLDKCSICGKTEKEVELETHHINEQRFADRNGFIESMHKNIKDNLMVLCRKCHSDVTSKNTQFNIIQTSNGTVISK